MAQHLKKNLLVSSLIQAILWVVSSSKALAVGLGGSIEPFGGYTVDTSNPDVTPYANQLEAIVSNTIAFLTILAGLYFIAYFLTGSIQWITAGGDANKLETAKQKLTNAAIGLIIVVASYSIIFIVGTILGLNILNLADLIGNSFTF